MAKIFGLFKDVGGHHGLGQATFRGNPDYTPGEHVTIGNEAMAETGFDHSAATAAQQKMWGIFHKSGGSEAMTPTPAFYDAVCEISARRGGMDPTTAQTFTAECRSRANELGQYETYTPYVPRGNKK